MLKPVLRVHFLNSKVWKRN